MADKRPTQNDQQAVAVTVDTQVALGGGKADSEERWWQRLRRRRRRRASSGGNGNGTSSLAARLFANAARPNVVTEKTLPPKWRALQSPWRYVHALIFYVGWPSHLLRRILPALLLNMALAAVIAADHVVRAEQRRPPLLPDLNSDVVRGLDPFVRYLMLSVSLLLALRLNRVYDRWFLARTSFSQVGSSALALCQRFETFVGDKDRALCDDVCRWAIVWHHSVLQVCMGRKSIGEGGAAFLHADELDVYNRSRKGRQLAVLKLVQLIELARLDPPVLLTVEGLLQRGVAAQGTCVSIRLQAMPYSLSLVSTGFVEVFLLLLPLSALGAAPHQPSAADMSHQGGEALFSALAVLLLFLFINVLFLSADQVANDLENAYDWFPADDIVRSTTRDCVRLFSEARELRALGGAGGGGDGGGAGGGEGGSSLARGAPRPLAALVPGG